MSSRPETSTPPTTTTATNSTSRPRHTFLKKKFQVGSCNGPSSFPTTEKVFNSLDVPPLKRANNKLIKEYLKPHLLGGGGRRWNDSTFGGEILFEKVKGFGKKGPGEGVAVKGDGDRYLPWSSSTLPLASEIRAKANKLATDSKANSMNKTTSLKNYTSIASKELTKQTLMRKIKSTHGDISKYIQTGVLVDSPPPPTHNRLSKEPSRSYREYKHSGVWKFNESEGCEMWSDTGSFVKESHGDLVRVVKIDKLNLCGP